MSLAWRLSETEMPLKTKIMGEGLLATRVRQRLGAEADACRSPIPEAEAGASFELEFEAAWQDPASSIIIIIQIGLEAEPYPKTVENKNPNYIFELFILEKCNNTEVDRIV